MMRKIKAVLLMLALVAVTAGITFAGTNTALLVIDGDSYLAHQAVANMALPEGVTVKVFCVSDLEKEPEKARQYLLSCPMFIVDVMSPELSDFVVDNDLLVNHTVYALRGSGNDDALKAKGFIFEPQVSGYFDYLDGANIQNMLLRALNLSYDNAIAYGPVLVKPENGIYHPQAPELCTDYATFKAWEQTRPDYNPDLPCLGLMFFSSSLVDGQREAFDELIYKLEAGGFNVLPVFGKDHILINSILLDEKREARVDAILAFSLKFYMSLDDNLKQDIMALDVPIFNAINLYSHTIESWRESPQGIAPLDVVWTIATPEITGVIEPTPIMGKIEEQYPQSGGRVYRYEVIPGMTERLIPRIHNWIKLRAMGNADKKVAIMYYNHSAGKQNVGASYLNVFRSLEEILAAMGQAGYQMPEGMPLDEAAIQAQVLKSGRNIGSWAPGELDELLASKQVLRLPVTQYKTWFAQLPADFQAKVLEQWGAPEDSDIMIKDGYIIIPMVRAGNIVLLPEPARGMSDDPMKLYHDPVLYPHHQYIAAYLWLQYGFKADAMVHLGTHATYEWLPGKQAGLSLSCPPEVMITDIPNVYPYIVDDVGEGIQAKRRGRGVIIDHLTPVLVQAESYGEYAEIRQLCKDLQQAESFDAQTARVYRSRVTELALELGLDKDLELDGVETDADIAAISDYLEHMEAGYIPYGVHTFGRSPVEELTAETAKAVVAQNPALKMADVGRRIKDSGLREMDMFLRALAGRYVPPAEGNDPVRNPDAVPTGSNFYGISPSRLPTKAAWELGQQAADQIISQYVAENGTYPEKVAVVLWAVEALRNEGLNEATILALIGVEPVWSPSGQVTGTQPIPGGLLGRPRVDVAIDISGLYRDLFPDKVLFIDAAIRQAAVQDDIENFISQNDAKIKQSLLEQGFSEADAGRFSRARIFSETPGAYGNRVSELTSASGLWEDDAAIADVFLTHTGYAYGNDFWGAPAEQALVENLKDAQVAWHSSSSAVYGLMDNDDMYMYLGGLSLAIRNVSGEAPRTLIADQRTLGAVKMESLSKQIGQEMRARYLNPKWIEGMMAENYAGARAMSNYVEYLWGWQVTTPDSVDETYWEQTYAVYVEDKYDMGLKEFLDENNPWAYQSMTARMLETTRKGYWEASDVQQQTLAAEYVMSVLNRGLACCDHTCNNPQFHQMVVNLVSLPGVMSPELVAEFKLAVEVAGQQSLEDMVAEREQLLQDLGEMRQQQENQAVSEESAELESVKGLKMEKVDDMAEKTSITSSGVEWFAAVCVLVVVVLFFIGLTRKRKLHL